VAPLWRALGGADLIAQIQGIGQAAHRLPAGAAGTAALQAADRVSAQRGPSGQFLLGQADRPAAGSRQHIEVRDVIGHLASFERVPAAAGGVPPRSNGGQQPRRAAPWITDSAPGIGSVIRRNHLVVPCSLLWPVNQLVSAGNLFFIRETARLLDSEGAAAAKVPAGSAKCWWLGFFRDLTARGLSGARRLRPGRAAR
jgi:hypothetical protein